MKVTKVRLMLMGREPLSIWECTPAEFIAEAFTDNGVDGIGETQP
jgi:hypothetical protein